MIEIDHVCKKYGDFEALSGITATIGDRRVFGLIGSNGSGKSTLLRTVAGILRPEEGEVRADGTAVYENPKAKEKIFYISDDQYYFRNAVPGELASFFGTFYRNFDRKRAEKLIGDFDLPAKRPVGTFSKGMKKQLSVILGLCSGCRYLLCDETFDGLDPQMRQAVKSLFAADMEERGLTPVIASHNLRELEDICDHVGLLHRGGILFSRDLDEMKLHMVKAQVVLPDENADETSFSGLDVLQCRKCGRLFTLTVRAAREEAEEKLAALSPVFYELLPLSLEEIFISETEVNGYDVRKLIF